MHFYLASTEFLMNSASAQVFSVVRDQIVRALTSQPLNFDKLKEKLQTLTYSKITNLWQQERTSREEWESHAKPIVQLKEIITPDIVDLIQKQRLGYLVEGTRFTKYSNRGQVGITLKSNEKNIFVTHSIRKVMKFVHILCPLFTKIFAVDC